MTVVMSADPGPVSSPWPFSRERAFLPVIHLPYGESGAFVAIDVAIEAGADGVFLINQGMSATGVLRLLPQVTRRYPDLWVGVNLLGESPDEMLALSEAQQMAGIWADDAGVSPGEDKWAELAESDWLTARARAGYRGLYFGGVAFKTQSEVAQEDLPWVAQTAARFVDVVTTSGRATGVAIRVEKLRAMREALGEHRLAVASGVSPENVEGILPYADAYLVATGIEREFGVLDPVRTKALADKIHG